MDNRLQTEASYWARSEVRSSLANVFLSLGLLGGTVGTFTLPFEYKYLAVGGGLGAAVAGLVNCRNGREAQGAGSDLKRVSEMNRTGRYYEATRPAVVSANLPEVFDWLQFADRPDLYPHAMLIGASGGGKTSLAENLGGILGGNTYAIVPHWQVGEFANCARVWCDENFRGYGAMFDERAFKPRTPLEDWDDMLRAIPVPDGADPIVTWSELEHGVITKPSVCQVFRAIWFEMRRRYKKGADGRFIGGEPVNLVVDEFNSLANLPGLRRLWLDLAREARKVGIRLIFIVQQNDVKSLDIEGQGGVRENLIPIYLSTAAEDRIRELISLLEDGSERQWWMNKYQLAQRLERKCVVMSQWAELPLPGAWVKITKVETYQDSSRDAVQIHTEAPKEVVRESEGGGKSKNEYTLRELSLYHSIAVDKANAGWKKGKIIKEAWGFKNDNYKAGLSLWRKVETEVGKIVLLEQQQECNELSQTLQSEAEQATIEE